MLSSDLALSTCWNSSRHTDGYAMLEEIRALGFERVELSHGIAAPLVEGILDALADGVVAVGSVHNFCPLPAGARGAAPNLFQPSARSKVERRAWLRHSRQTLDFAERVGATHVVMHSGSFPFRFASPVEALASPDETPPPRRERALRRLRKRAAAISPRVEQGYRELLPDVAERGLVLGLENREGILEFPLDEALPAFLGHLDDPCLGYWHDTGHAEIKRRLGLLDSRAHLESLADRLVGFHLHDVDDSGRDHRPVGSGSVDFKEIAHFVRPGQLFVLEPSPRLDAEEVGRSRERLLELLS